ncbi:MAG: fumarylacetoacetase, partial [Xanthomonadaceae bacterium]|nr:fumarylacetoacetase [Xanthomonadaceae bacterium]
MAKSAPDGYTLLMAGVGGRTILPQVAKLPYDPAKDLLPVTRIANSPNIFVVNAAHGERTLAELVKKAKAQPGKLNLGLAAPGTLTHFTGTLLQQDAGISLTEVSYKGGAPTVNALLGGEIDIMTADIGSVMAQLQGGKLLALAVADNQRLPTLPNVPTTREAGYPNIVAINVYGLYAPAGTPRAIVARIAEVAATVLRQPEVQEIFAKQGVFAESSTPETFETLNREQTKRWGTVAKASANLPECDFPLQSLPLCVFSQSNDATRPGVGIGDQVLDLRLALPLMDAIGADIAHALQSPRLNALFALGRPALLSLRHAVWRLLEEGSAQREAACACLLPQAALAFSVPCEIGDYTDFFSSLNHAMNTFRLFRPGQVFLPNFKHLPIAYHGRASSIVASGVPLRRPLGQLRPDPEQPPVFGPSRKLDIEVELGFYVGPGNALGEAIAQDDAEAHMVGFSVLNDWSARDVQAFESQPLGPFLSKNFLSSVSPWVVTLDALAPFRAPLAAREAGDPASLPYLESPANTRAGAFDIQMETRLQTRSMREQGLAPACITTARFSRDAWWTPAQMLAHHTVGGCNLRPGDFVGSGTISGPDDGTQGSLLELTHGGAKPLTLP